LKTRIAVLISGRGSNLHRILDEARDGLLCDCCDVAGVISNRHDAPGLAIADAYRVPARVVPSAGVDRDAYGRRLLQVLEAWSIEVVVLAGFMRILSEDVVTRYPERILNIHPADTRAYQGPDGYGWAYERRLERTWVTVHLIDEGIDTGRILEQAPVSLTGAETREDVAARGLAVEHELYPRVLRAFLIGRVGEGGWDVWNPWVVG